MKTEYLAYLLEVVKQGSINKASQKLLLKQQNLSKVIKNLEKEFGITIFERNQKGILLTPKGIHLVDTATKILALLDELPRTLAQEDNNTLEGTLFLHASPRMWVEDYKHFVNNFSTKHPQVAIQLNEKINSAIVSTIEANPTHVGLVSILFGPNIVPLTIPPALIFTELYQRKVVVYTAQHGYFAKNYKSFSLKNILDFPLIAKSNGNLEESVQYELLKHYGTPVFKYCVNDISTVYELLQKKNCLYIGASDTAENMQSLADSKNIIAIPIRENAYYSGGVLFHQANQNNPLFRGFKEVLTLSK